MSQSPPKPDPTDAAEVSCAILIVSYNGRALLADCLESVFASDDAPPAGQVVIVDNASGDGTADFVAERYPEVRLERLDRNTGFVGGNNVGFELVRREMPRVRYVALLNQDTLVRPGWLRAMREMAEARPTAGSVQAKLLFHPETTLINSAGNKSHYLGFGFVSAYREVDAGQYDSPRELAFCSGAAMLVRVEAMARETLFDDAYFAYLEDAELGWYLRVTGWTNVYCPASVVHHRYQFSRNPQMYYRLERNRWRLLLAYYRWRTLILILPAALMMEGGLLFYFLKAGAMRQKLRSWDALRDWGEIMQRRRAIQRARKIGDRALAAPFVATADFPEVRNPLLTYIGNPLLAGWWKLVRPLVR